MIKNLLREIVITFTSNYIHVHGTWYTVHCTEHYYCLLEGFMYLSLEYPENKMNILRLCFSLNGLYKITLPSERRVFDKYLNIILLYDIKQYTVNTIVNFVMRVRV